MSHSEQAPATEHVPNTPIARAPFWRAVLVTTDWNGAVAKETWYGHHGPWRRLLLWMFVPGIIQSLAIVVSLGSSRLLALDFDTVYNHSLPCMNSFCKIAQQDVMLDCEVNSNGQPTTLWNDYEGVDSVPIPIQCKDFYMETVGRADSLSSEFFTFLNEYNFLQVTPLNEKINKPAIWTVAPDCAIQSWWNGTESAELIPPDPIPLLMADAPPGRVSNVLETWFCPERMPKPRKDFLDAMYDATKSAFEYRRTIATVFLLVFHLLVATLQLHGYMFRLLFTTMVARYFFPNPSRDFVGLKQQTYWSTWRALLMVSVVSCHSSMIGATTCVLYGIISALAMHCKEKRAAAEWAFLAVLNFGFESVFPLLDSIASTIHLFDAFNIVGFCGSILGLTVPGHGWWKLVTLYFFYVAYAPVRVWKENRNTNKDDMPFVENPYRSFQ